MAEPLYDTSGIGYLTLQYSGDLLDTATSIDSNVLSPLFKTYFRFKSATSNFIKGTILTGQSSSATLRVEAIVITSGTLAGNDAAGIAFCTLLTGVMTAGENLRVATTTYCVSTTAVLTIPIPDSIFASGAVRARTIIVSVETNAIRYTYDGSSTPTTSTESTGPVSFGTILNALDVRELREWDNVTHFKMINAVAASNATVTIEVLY